MDDWMKRYFAVFLLFVRLFLLIFYWNPVAVFKFLKKFFFFPHVLGPEELSCPDCTEWGHLSGRRGSLLGH